MRNLILCALLACDVEGVPVEGAAELARGEDPNSKGDASDGDVEVLADCLDEACTALWFSLDPPATEPVHWWVDGEDAGEGYGLKLETPKAGALVEADTSAGTRSAGATGGQNELGAYVVVQTFRSCDEFRIVTVGGCINGTSGVSFVGPGLRNPYAATTAASDVRFGINAPNADLQDIGWAWGAWWPASGAQQQRFNFPPPQVQTPLTTNLGLAGVEIRHAVAPGTSSSLSVVHGGPGTAQTPVFSVACSRGGVPSLLPSGMN
jgi:hypothetical protein